jgi:hypothetical protein
MYITVHLANSLEAHCKVGANAQLGPRILYRDGEEVLSLPEERLAS